MADRCLILELPPEIREQIWNYIYDQPSYPWLILRDDTKVLRPLQPPSRHPGAALLKTCRLLYAEVGPVLYNRARFRIQIYIGDGWPKYQDAGPADSTNPLIRQLQHVDITIHLVNEEHLDPAFHRLGLLARALEDGKADLRTVRVTFKAVTSYRMAVTRARVAAKIDLVLRLLDEERHSAGGAGAGEGRLFRRMLTEGRIDATQPPITS